VIKIEDLNVRIGQRNILTDINIEIEDGKWTCLVGPNGAGKTTLLKSLLGSQAYSGSITDSGVEVFKNHDRNGLRPTTSADSNRNECE
jgi:ABC-type Mn2+/Zn2+ transport system ATPase subunit